MPVVTKEMTDWFEKRTAMHIEYVQEAIEKIVEKYPEFSALRARGKVHDASKYQDPERNPYVWITWRYKQQREGKKFEYPAGIKKSAHEATNHHVLTNSHHPEYHAGESKIGKENRDKAKARIDATSMPDLDVAEMVADWAAMSRELGTNSARKWFEENSKTRWKFSDHQKVLIDRLLKVFETKMTEKLIERLSKVQSTLKESYDTRGGDGKLVTTKGKFKYSLDWYEVWFTEYGGRYVRSEVAAMFEYEKQGKAIAQKSFRSDEDAEKFYDSIRTETAYKEFIAKVLKKQGFPRGTDTWTKLELEAIRSLFTPAELSLIAL